MWAFVERTGVRKNVNSSCPGLRTTAYQNTTTIAPLNDSGSYTYRLKTV